MIPKNVKKATKYFVKSAKLGNARGNLFAYLKTDKPKYLFESCINNYPNAINALGYESRYSKLSKKEMKFILWIIAAKLGSAVAKYNLGYIYKTGDTVKKDINKAAYWYYKAL